MTDQTLNALVKRYYEARDLYDEAKKVSDEADRQRRVDEHNLVSYMIEHQIKNVKFADGTTPMLVKSVSISVTQENYDEIRQWLRDTVGDDADFMVTIPHKPAILEFVKKKIAEGDDETDFPDFLNCSTRPTLRVDGWKTRDK